MKGNNVHIISGRGKKLLDLVIKSTVFVLALYEYRSFGKVRMVLNRLVRLGREINGTGEAPRMVLPS